LHINQEVVAMPDIRHHVGINAPRGEIYDALATRDGLQQWWTSTVTGESQPNERLTFHFGRPEPSAVMEVVELVPDKRVRWQCVVGPDEWLGTTLTFELKPNDEETFLVFTHGDWREPSDFMAHCSTKWAYFLLGLKAGLEGGKATPWPGDMPISSWG
jgi:uncharacterized protein YndB with AHSA1/START domain